MDALVMAGGRGTRLGMGEKPLVKLLGRPLIHYVVTALVNSSVDQIYVATTDNVPQTRNWAENQDFIVIDTPSTGFVADMVHAAEKARLLGPILIVMADLPLVTPDILDEIIEIYDQRPEPALSTHTPFRLHAKLGRQPDSLFNYNGQLIVPAGINILNGATIKDEQDDYHLIMERIELAVNVNVVSDLKLCESILLGDVF